jgi:hypothetical protein
MELQGQIKLIGETQTFGEKGFRKRELVITTDDQYPQDILIEFVQDKTEILDKYKAGAVVEVGINIRGREWINPEGTAKYFNSIQGWNIKKLEDAGGDDAAGAATPQEAFEDTPDDLPF